MKSNCIDPDHCLPFYFASKLLEEHGIIEQMALVKVQTAGKGNTSVKWAIIP